MPVQKLQPTFNLEQDRVEMLKQLIPEAVSDGKIDWDVLKEALGEYLEDEGSEAEHFGLSWAGKRDARRLASIPSKGTLVPVLGEGIDEDTTSNIFIEGDNLEVLKLLQKSYAGRVKLIYIDPPYNTGNDFIYKDDFSEPTADYLKKTGQADEEGNLLTSNPKSGGRYHSNWLSMMYPRLRLAKSLLTDDGVIFISISDHEIHNLLHIMNEIFGEENLIASLIWKTDGNFDNQAKIKNCHEYLILYAKNAENFPHPPVIDPSIPKSSKLFKPEIRNTIVKNGSKNPISIVEIPAGFPTSFSNGYIRIRSNEWPHYLNDVEITDFKTNNPVKVSSGWSSKDLLLEFIDNNYSPIVDSKEQETKFLINETGTIEIIKTRSKKSHVISVLSGLGSTQAMSAELENIGISFDYPKPVNLMKYIISMIDDNNFTALELFAGSASMSEAIVQVNVDDGGMRRFICIQIPEKVKGGSKAQNQGFTTISELSIVRLKKSLNLINERIQNQLLTIKNSGFKVYKLDRSNLKIWKDYDGEDIQAVEQLLLDFQNPLGESLSEEKVVTELHLLEGFPLDSKIEQADTFTQNKVLCVTSEHVGHHLFICLDSKLDIATVQDVRLLEDEDIFICVDNALTDQEKMMLADGCNVKTI